MAGQAAGPILDAAGHDVPLVEAAALLGCTPEALRKRLQRGSAAGHKRGGEWYAWLPASGLGAGSDGLPGVLPGVQPRQDTAGQDGRTGQDAAAAGRLAIAEALLTEIRAERDHLRILVERGDQERAELRRLVVLAWQRPALPPADTEREDPHRPAARSWWRRWPPWRAAP